MTDIIAATGRWIAAACLIAVLACLVITGIGKRRGTRLHAIRSGLYSAIIGLMAALGLAAASSGCVPHTCYEPLPTNEPPLVQTDTQDAGAVDAVTSPPPAAGGDPAPSKNPSEP